MAKNDNSQTGDLYKKDIPKMPEGYYLGDKPNSNLRAFVEQHTKERPYDSETDNYNVPDFDKPIESTKATAIYNMHTYWSKKPHGAIRTYIQHYTKPGDLIIDVFSGSGGVGCASRQLSRNAILGDLSPFCSFLSTNYTYALCFDESMTYLNRILTQLESNYSWMYSLGKSHVESFLHSDKIRCIKCLNAVYVADCKSIGKSTYTCPKCGEEWSSRSNSVEWIEGDVWGVFRKSGRSLKVERLTDDERFLLRESEQRALKELEQLHLPDMPIPQTLLDLGGRLETTKTTMVKKLYSVRVQLLLARMLEQIEKLHSFELKIALKFVVSSVLLNLTLMYQYRQGGGGKPGGGGAYYVPPVRRELGFFNSIRDKLQDIIKGREEQIKSFNSNSHVMISTEDAFSLLQGIPANSIDYVFTDPPYAGTMPYAALNCVWDYWLFGGAVNYKNEILGENWRIRMMEIARALFRVLKPGRCVSVCYHDTSEGTWEDLQDVMAMAGFLAEQVSRALAIDTSQKSYQQLRGDKVVKRDLIINFRKPKPGEVMVAITITGTEDKTTFSEKVHQIVRDYLDANPGSTKDRVYDEVVSRMVRSGQMEAHNFDELLSQVADEARVEGEKDQGGRWYLKETELVVADAAETDREDTAAAKLCAFIKGHLKKHPGDEGVHYSNLFENYIYSVKDKPRRQLADFLPDYFYKTDQGTWRLPASEEEDRAKREARVKGLGRRVKHYIAQLEQGVIIPDQERPNDSTLAEWLRHCKRSGLYEQGKLLYEKGGLNLDNLTEDALVNAEEDYQVCVRMLARAGGVGAEIKLKRGRKV